MKNSENFRDIVELIRAGQDVSQEELVDCCGYASDGMNEMYVLLRAFRDGYKAQLDTINRKQKLLESKLDEIKRLKQINWVLNRKLISLGLKKECIPDDEKAPAVEETAGAEK